MAQKHKRRDYIEPVNLVTPNLMKIHNCIICCNQGSNKRGKEGRNMNLGQGIMDLQFHYAQCYFNEGALRDIIDCGDFNKDANGAPIDESGSKFKYLFKIASNTPQIGLATKV